MAMTYKAVLQDLNGKPIASRDIRALARNKNGSQVVRGTAKTNAKGAVLIKDASMALGTFAPYIKLQYKDGSRYKDLTDTPVSMSGTAIDFGVQKIEVALQIMALRTTGIPLTTVAKADTERLKILESDVVTLNKRIETETAAKASISVLLDQRTKSLSSTQELLRQRDTELNSVNSQLKTLKSSSSSNALQIKNLSSENATLASQLKAKDAQILKEKQAVEAKFSTQISAKNQELARLNKEISTISEAQGADVSMPDLLSRLSDNLEEANTRLKKNNNEFKLNDVSIKIKALPGQNGNGLSFIKRDELEKVDANVLSEISIKYRPDNGANKAGNKNVAVPDVSGYTERLAHRKLREAGLKIEFEYESVIDVEGQPSRHGRVVAQSPQAHAQVDPGTRIWVTIGKRTLIEAG